VHRVLLATLARLAIMRTMLNALAKVTADAIWVGSPTQILESVVVRHQLARAVERQAFGDARKMMITFGAEGAKEMMTLFGAAGAKEMMTLFGAAGANRCPHQSGAAGLKVTQFGAAGQMVVI